MSCSVCKREIKIVARGLCRACYSRWHSRGTTDYAPKSVPVKCKVEDCEGMTVSHGYCDTHRLRLRRHGHLEDTRPDSWGAIEKHPLRESWRWLMRRKGITGREVHPSWDDFLCFASDVGDRPSSKHRLLRLDESAPYGPGNFEWSEPIWVKKHGEEYADLRRRYQRNYRVTQSKLIRNTRLKKAFGISLEDYELMFTVQSGKCAICAKPETAVIRGKTLLLAVDHCHATGEIRALLCKQCNQGLGCFKDDPGLLRRAAAYVSA